MGTQYEPGLRVPFIVWRAGLEQPGSVNQGLLAFTDLTPTFLEWAAVKFEKYPLHGRSLYPLPIDTFERRIWTGIRERGETMIGPRTVDQFLHRPQLELYDLENDPWEVANLASMPTHRERAEQMARELVQVLTGQKDPWLRKYQPLRASQADREP